MAEAIDVKLCEAVAASSRSTREAVFAALLREIVALRPGDDTIPLIDTDGSWLGVFHRPAPLASETERQAWKADRAGEPVLDLDDVVEAEDVRRALRSRSPVAAG